MPPAKPTPSELWDAFLASDSSEAPVAASSDFSAWHFGTGGEMADELLALVIGGRKRATAGALWSYELEGDPVPHVGEYSVVLDGSGAARCIIKTVSVEIVPFEDVSEEFAAAEGEGDLSLEYWREGHWHYFTQELEAFGRTPTSNMPVVCERFEVVFVPGQA